MHIRIRHNIKNVKMYIIFFTRHKVILIARMKIILFANTRMFNLHTTTATATTRTNNYSVFIFVQNRLLCIMLNMLKLNEVLNH